MPKKIIIVRHGETDYNKERRMQGWLDIPLNDVGIAQAIASSTKLVGVKIDAIYSSDLVRAHETAKHISSVAKIDIVATPALRERDMGIFSGWRWESEPDPEKEKLWVEFESARDNEDIHWNKHRGESMHQMTTRVKDFMDQIHKSHQDQTVVIVSHGGTINRLLEIYNFKSSKEGFRDIKNASLLVMYKETIGYRLEEI